MAHLTEEKPELILNEKAEFLSVKIIIFGKINGKSGLFLWWKGNSGILNQIISKRHNSFNNRNAFFQLSNCFP